MRSIDRVPESLNALLAGFEDESSARAAVSSGQLQWCADTLAEKKEAAQTAREEGEEHVADLRDAESRRDAAIQRVTDIKGKISSSDSELSELEKSFDSKKAAFKRNLEDLQQATGAVAQSVFTQHFVRREDSIATLRSLDSALLKDSAPSFLQVRSDEVAGKALEETEEELRTQWAAAQKELRDMVQQKKSQVANLESDLETAQLGVAEAQSSTASLTRGKNAADRAASREQSLATTLDSSCATQKEYFEEQEKLRVEAKAAVQDALKQLGEASQTSLTQFSAPSFVQLTDFGGAPAASAAYAQMDASSDPLADVKAKIEGMVQALQAAANAETGPDDFCSQEQAKNREKKRSKTDDIDRLASESRKKGFELDGLIGAQRSAQGAINQLSILKAHIDSFATVEQTKVKNMVKDHELSVQVLDKAVSLIQSEFGLALVQGALLSPQVAAQKAVSALKLANEKIRTLSSRAGAYLTKLATGGQEELLEVTRALRSEEQELATAKTEEATKRDEISQAETAEDTARAELTVITTYIENLGKQCGPQLGNSYEELKRQREEEIQALHDAVKVLDGEGVPSLAMVQKPSAVQRAALALGVA